MSRVSHLPFHTELASSGLDRSGLTLEHFVKAAHVGRLVWVHNDDQGPYVASGPREHPQARSDLGRLLATALCQQYGEAVGREVERQFDFLVQPHRSVPGRTILRATECAEATLSLWMGLVTALRFEYSAVFLGRGFRQVCWNLGINPTAMSLERRQALDETLLATMPVGLPPPSTEVLRQQLCLLLTQVLH